MALVPFLLQDELLRPLLCGCNRPVLRQKRGKLATRCCVLDSQYDSNGFKVNLDVQQFRPDELNVKVVDDVIVVEGKHEERKDDHGYIARQFQRLYKLRDDIDLDGVSSALSSDGILTITAPVKQPVPLPGLNERIIPVIHT
ncbi:protein lethal(2)essential for life [Anabrus simplex]|uniref:protein lethal(2)essential for life n=1 Tax=Anabrus simplex TaxID=316456 RepID=UPI0034DD0D13